jgi:hypothetical protein
MRTQTIFNYYWFFGLAFSCLWIIWMGQTYPKWLGRSLSQITILWWSISGKIIVKMASTFQSSHLNNQDLTIVLEVLFPLTSLEEDCNYNGLDSLIELGITAEQRFLIISSSWAKSLCLLSQHGWYCGVGWRYRILSSFRRIQSMNSIRNQCNIWCHT